MSRFSSEHRIWPRYLLFQLPSWAAVGLGLGLAHTFEWIAAPWSALLFAGLVVKDLVLYPWMKIAYEPSLLHGAPALVDACGVVEIALTPEGHVRIGPERWRARCESGAPATVGDRVRVRAVDGLTLIVEPEGR